MQVGEFSERERVAVGDAPQECEVAFSIRERVGWHDGGHDNGSLNVCPRRLPRAWTFGSPNLRQIAWPFVDFVAPLLPLFAAESLQSCGGPLCARRLAESAE